MDNDNFNQHEPPPERLMNSYGIPLSHGLMALKFGQPDFAGFASSETAGGKPQQKYRLFGCGAASEPGKRRLQLLF